MKKFLWGLVLVSVAAVSFGQSGNLFVPLVPCRVIDTRFDGSGAMQQDEFRTMTIGGVCGVPLGVVAVSVNIAAADIQGGVPTNGVLKVGLPEDVLLAKPADFQVPCGTRPCEAWLNFTKPYVTQINNSGVAVVNNIGQIVVGLFQGGGSADVIIDVNGYYVPGIQTGNLAIGTGSIAPLPGGNLNTSQVNAPNISATSSIQLTYDTYGQGNSPAPLRVVSQSAGTFTVQGQQGSTFHYLAISQ